MAHSHFHDPPYPQISKQGFPSKWSSCCSIFQLTTLETIVSPSRQVVFTDSWKDDDVVLCCERDVIMFSYVFTLMNLPFQTSKKSLCAFRCHSHGTGPFQSDTGTQQCLCSTDQPWHHSSLTWSPQEPASRHRAQLRDMVKLHFVGTGKQSERLGYSPCTWESHTVLLP